MRQVREVLRLTTAGVGLNEIARRAGVAPSTVRLTLKRLASAGLSWPLPAEMTDTALETALFAAAGTKQGHRRHVEPDWAEIHRELKRKHVTLTMLWDEYIERCPEGYRYSRFCELYRNWASRLSVTMRQAHIGGDKRYKPRPPRATKLDPFRDYVVERLASAAPERIPASVLLRELRERGYTGGYTRLKVLVAALKPKEAAAPIVRFET
jgi:transposase